MLVELTSTIVGSETDCVAAATTEQDVAHSSNKAACKLTGSSAWRGNMINDQMSPDL